MNATKFARFCDVRCADILGQKPVDLVEHFARQIDKDAFAAAWRVGRWVVATLSALQTERILSLENLARAMAAWHVAGDPP